MMRYHMRRWGGWTVLLLLLSGLLGGISAESTRVYGQTLVVPVYPEIPYAEGERTIALTVTLRIHNLDRQVAITVSHVDYYNAQGKRVRAYLQEPRVLPAFAAAEFVLKASDRSGGISASFLVTWESATRCLPPVVEALMIGTASTQGIAFSSQAHVVEEKR
jgi:hypothetical protein